MIQENLINYFESSFKDNWKNPALSDYKGEGLTYGDVAQKILRLHILFERNGINRGDKISLIGKNSAAWAITYLATISYGAVIVPILSDFKPNDVHHIINHSDSVLLFAGDRIFETLEITEMPNVKAVFSLPDFSISFSRDKQISNDYDKLDDLFVAKYPNGLFPEIFSFPSISNKELAVISYTSGTTGFSKGVMLSYNSLAANVRFARNNMPLSPGDNIVSFLPLAHAYGCSFEFLFPVSLGCHITFLTKTPSPQIVTQAFDEIRPRLILSVPLIIEKIYKKQLLPTISKPIIKAILKIPGINQLLYRKINRKLTEVFGGNFFEVVIGGAPFNVEAEAFFRKIKFPATVGYGMTECGPLISYASWKTSKFQSAGRKVDSLEVRIDSENPNEIVGEILVKGENVMLGYYKNKEATDAVIDNEGWLHTGDMGLFDKDGNLYIKGRCKTMILGASGQNIYPEEIESLLNNKFGILESLVIEDNGRLKALIYPDYESIEYKNIDTKALEEMMSFHIKELNHQLPSYMNIANFVLHPEEFEKTPKRSIKRFLYTNQR
ncbi:MAG TPA: AMP-binding protein [Bacteroidales bacterium]